MADAPNTWPELLAWAAKELVARPDPVPISDQPRLATPKWPILHLEERLERASIRCDWRAAATGGEAFVSLGPYRSDLPGPDFAAQSKPDAVGPGVEMLIKGFVVRREDVGCISIELRQPFGEHFELRWSRAGRIRVPVPDNERFWTLNVATDGFAEWTGPLQHLQLRANGIGDQPVEIRSVRFLSRAESFPQPVGVRRVALDHETRTVLYVHCPGEVSFHALALPARATLQFGLGGIAASDDGPSGVAASLAVLVEHDGRTHTVWTGSLPPGPAWREVTVSLAPWGGQTVSLTLRSSTDSPGTVVCWANPAVYQPLDHPPCVIVYLIDALAAGHVDLYGYRRATMPGLSALARRGVWFANALANSPRTVESVPDLMLSLPTESHGVYHPSATAPAELVTLPEALREAGFATASFSTNVNAGPRQNIDQGFDHFFDRIAYSWTGRADRTVPIEEVMNWLHVHRDRPAFIYIHTAEPHAPYTPPKGFAGRFDPDYDGPIDGTYDRDHGFKRSKNRRDLAHVVALYDEEVAYADSRLSLFLDALEANGLLDRTHIFVTADHGEEFREHGSWGHGNHLHGEAIRIPLVAAGPRFAARGRNNTPAQLYDLMPTILDMFDLPRPYSLAGRSLLPCLTGAVEGVGHDRLGDRPIIASNHSYCNRGYVQFAVIEAGRWKLMFPFPPKPAGQKSGERRFALFDLQADPGELRDVIEAHQDIARGLIGRLLEWRRRHAPFQARAPRHRLLLDAEQLNELRSLGYIE